MKVDGRLTALYKNSVNRSLYLAIRLVRVPPDKWLINQSLTSLDDYGAYHILDRSA